MTAIIGAFVSNTGTVALIKAGLPLQVIMGIVMTVVLPMIFPF